MKKNIKYFKRWMALLLAVVLVAGTCVYSSSGSLRATDGVDPMTEEAASDVTEEETEPEVVVVSEGDETEPEEGETADINMPEEEPAAAEGEESTGKTENAEEVPSEDGKTEEETTTEEKTENEKAEEKTEEKLQEELAVEMPAQTLKATAEDGATVKVSAPEGALPKGATVTISVVTDKDVLKKFEDAAEVEGKVLTGLKAYDVTIWDADGNEIQPDKKVEVTISNTGMDGDDATIFHADDENAPVKKVKDIDDANNATFDAQHFSVNTIITYDLKVLATYADEEPTYEFYKEFPLDAEIMLDELIKEKGFEYDGNYNWKIEQKSGVVRQSEFFTDNDKGMNVLHSIGIGKADVEVSKDGKKVAVFHITIKASTVTNPVYIYVKLDGMLGEQSELSEDTIKKLKAIGLSVNDHGWCTVGKLEEASIDTPLSGKDGVGKFPAMSDPAENEIIEKVKSGNITLYGNHKVDLNAVSWNNGPENDDFGLLVANGADDYVEGKNVWHLNGYLDVKNISYTIRYQDKDTHIDIADSKTIEVPGTNIGKEIPVDVLQIDGYEYVNSDPENEKLTLYPSNNVITLYYQKQNSKVKVYKSATVDKDKMPAEKAKEGQTIHYTIEVENTTSGRDLENIVIKDIMHNASGKIDLSTVKGAKVEYDEKTNTATFTIDKIPQAVGETASFVQITYDYIVKEEDMGKTLINNVTVGTSGIEIEDSTTEKKVEIEKADLNVTANSGNKVYDGKTVEDLGFVESKLVNIPKTELKGICVKYKGNEYYINGITAGLKGSPKDAGTYSTEVLVTKDAKVFDTEGNDVTGRFNIKGITGTYTITPRKVFLRSASLEKEYDGTALSNANANDPGVIIVDKDIVDPKVMDNGLLVESGWVEGEGVIEYTFSTESRVLLPNASVENKFTYKLKENTKASNYNITEEYGTLSITNRKAPYKVTLLTNSGNFDYDGKKHEVSGFVNRTDENGNIIEVQPSGDIKVNINGETYTISNVKAYGDGITVTDYPENYGGYPVRAEVKNAMVKDEKGNDVSRQFNIEYKEGLVTINELPITITAGSSTHKYTGELFTVNNSDITSATKLVDKQFYKATYSGSQQLVGKSESKIENIWIYNEKGEEVTGNYKVTLIPGEISVTDGTDTDKVDDKLVINKEAKQTTGYEVGNVVEFTIVIKNIFNEKQDVILEELPGVRFDKYEDDATWFGKLVNGVKDALSIANQKKITIDPGKEEKVTVYYRITEKDILKGEFINIATVKLNGKTYEAKCDVKTVEPNGHIKITKTEAAIRDAKGNIVSRDPGLGDIIEYNIQVENKGNLVMKNVILTDKLPITFIPNMLDGGRVEDGKVVFDELGINGHKKITVQYKVTESDILHGSVTNVATATAEVPEGAPDPTIDRGTVTTDTAEPNGHITLKKYVLDPKTEYALGATVQYKIEATNDGNITVKNLKVEDVLTGNTVANGKEFTIPEIKPGETLFVGEVSYTIDEDDIKASQSKMTNIATGTGETEVSYPDKEEEIPVIVEEGKADVTVEKDRPSLSITKTADKTTDVKPGDVITYTITVTNNGNVTIKNIMAEDALTGKVGAEALINNGTLAPRESKTFTETYKVTEKDILAGKVVNTATVKGDNTVPGGENPKDEAVVEIPTAAIEANYMVEKFVQNPQTEYRVGNTISYVIMVKNLGNVTLENVVVEDQLSNATGRVTFTTINGNPINETDPMAPGTRVTLNPDNTVTIAALAPGEEAVLNCQYTVVRADAGRNIQNAAAVKTDPVRPTGPEENPNPIDPGEETTPEVPANVENIYDLIIHYVYADGTTAAADVTGQYLKGETYGYESPAIAGYTPNYAFIRSGADGMPARRVELFVTYTATPGTPTPTPTPTTTPTPTPTPTPVPPTPIVVVPGTPAPVPTPTPVLIGEEEVPLGGEVNVDDNGNVNIVPVEDEEVPLANRDLDDHACCLFHFLLAVATIIIYAFFTKSMKKRQAKVNELKDQLETELLKRKLGIADDKDQTV